MKVVLPVQQVIVVVQLVMRPFLHNQGYKQAKVSFQ